jgi:hypothetical protein
MPSCQRRPEPLSLPNHPVAQTLESFLAQLLPPQLGPGVLDPPVRLDHDSLRRPKQVDPALPAIGRVDDPHLQLGFGQPGVEDAQSGQRLERRFGQGRGEFSDRPGRSHSRPTQAGRGNVV